MHRYKAIFPNGDPCSLYGQDFFGDRPEFSRAHLHNVNSFIDKFKTQGFPILIQYQGKGIFLIDSIEKLDFWCHLYQGVRINEHL